MKKRKATCGVDLKKRYAIMVSRIDQYTIFGSNKSFLIQINHFKFKAIDQSDHVTKLYINLFM